MTVLFRSSRLRLPWRRTHTALVGVFLLVSLIWTQQATAQFWSNDSSKTKQINPGQCPRYTPPESTHWRMKKVTTNPCKGQKTSIVEWTRLRVLFLCKDNQLVKSYDLALGRGGLYKTKGNDLKTPIGVYPVGAPVKSEQFGIFIPVGYPTPEEVEQGYTGDAIGIHGPHRHFRCVGFLNVAINWTAGCQAVASDSLIIEIATWVRARLNEGPLFVSILDELNELTPAQTTDERESEHPK